MTRTAPRDPALAAEPLERWEGHSPGDLGTLWGAAEVHLFRSVGSTNDLARSLGAPPVGARVVLADEQLSGRGREGRPWHSPPAVGVWFSAVFRISDAAAAAALPIRTGLELAGALDPFTGGEAVKLKWPNDLILAGRKLGGILCEGSWDGGGAGQVVVGVGLNVLQGEEDFRPEIAGSAVSLAMLGSRLPGRSAVATAAVRAVLRAGMAPRLIADVGAEIEARDYLRDHTVSVLEPRSGELRLQGVARGISREGALLVESAGRMHEVRSGTIRLGDA